MCVRLFMGRWGQNRWEENKRVGAFAHCVVGKKRAEGKGVQWDQEKKR